MGTDLNFSQFLINHMINNLVFHNLVPTSLKYIKFTTHYADIGIFGCM